MDLTFDLSFLCKFLGYSLGKSDLSKISYFAYLVTLKDGYLVIKDSKHCQENRQTLEDRRFFPHLLCGT